jgi:hypothetical protein
MLGDRVDHDHAALRPARGFILAHNRDCGAPRPAHEDVMQYAFAAAFMA